MAYVEGDFPIYAGNNGYNNGFGNGWEGLIGLAIVASLFGGWGNGGFGLGGRGGSSSEFVGYELGKVATQADVASGFNNSAVLSSLNDIKLGQATMQNFINQGFNGINTQLLTGFHGVDNAVCTLGYNLTHQISDCCCGVKSAIADLKYANERQTCELLNAGNANTQRIIDYLTNDKIDTLNRKLAVAEGQLSNNAQSRYIVDTVIDRLSPCPKPAYFVPNPNCCYSPCGNTTFGGTVIQ